MDTVLGTAQADAATACAALDAMRNTEFTRILDNDLLSLAKSFERTARLVWAAQIHIAGEIDIRRMADSHGCTSSTALLRQTLTISAPEARARVNAAKAVLHQELPSGGETEPVLPLLADALAAGSIGVEQTRTIVATMNKLPAGVEDQMRELCQKLLVENGIIVEPKPFADFARSVALICDPDGKLDERGPSDRVELSLGSRNPTTGMTGFRGQLDDVGVELLEQAIKGLAQPRPATDGTRDQRSLTTRRGQALKEVLRRYLDVGDAPILGGERPHITLTMSFEDLQEQVGAAYLEHGGPISAAQARILACDAVIIPAVLGSPSQVLDIGTATRIWPAAIRRAIILRDKGCAWYGCDRPPGWCEIHHSDHWVAGGHTSYHKGVLFCGFHHAEIHKGHWEIRFAADGVPELVPPPWVDRDRKPRRNNAHHITDVLKT